MSHVGFPSHTQKDIGGDQSSDEMFSLKLQRFPKFYLSLGPGFQPCRENFISSSVSFYLCLLSITSAVSMILVPCLLTQLALPPST